jgi:membrane-associated HD superfamily phosphohydrolase
MRRRARIEVTPGEAKKKRLPATTGSPLKSQRPRERRRLNDYIALLVVVVVVVLVVVVAFMSVAFMAFMSVAFMSVVVVVFMSVVVRFSSTFMVLLALSLLLHAATARAAPATRIRARIQDSLFIAI